MKGNSKSYWIWSKEFTDHEKEEPSLFLFRKNYKLKGPDIQGSIKISADTRYKLYINGCLVEVGPSKGDNQVWFLDEIDVSKYLKSGENIIGVKVLRYPIEPEKGTMSMFRTAHPGLYVKLSVTECKDGRVIGLHNVYSDSSWKVVQDGTFRIVDYPLLGSLQIYEAKTGNFKTHNWLSEQYDDYFWSSAMEYVENEINPQVSPGNLLPRNIPFMYRSKRRFSRVITVRSGNIKSNDWEELLRKDINLYIPKHTKVCVEISADEEMTGYLNLEMFSGKGAKIEILQAESYLQEGTTSTNGFSIPIKTDREDYINGHLDGPADHYVVDGFGSVEDNEVFEPFFFRTFRFIKLYIETDNEDLWITKFFYEETGYPLEVISSGETSDPSLNKTWEISERTLRRCMHETYEDCPYYEQLQYIMDSRSQILYTYSISGDDRLARKCMDDFKRSQRYDGLLNCCYPSVGTNVIPTFSIYYILILQDHMMYFGDKSLIRYHLPVVERILDYFNHNLSSDGLVKKIGGLNDTNVDRFWSFVDWTPEWNKTNGVPRATLKGALTIESLLYVLGLQAAASLASFINKNELADDFIAQSKITQQAIRKYCTSKEGMIKDGPSVDQFSQHVQVFSILTNTVGEDQGKKNLYKTIYEKEKYAQCSVSMAFYLFRALEKVKLYQYTNEYWNIWRRMIKNNATTCIEAESGDRSDCHAWGALILYELPSTILGIRPGAPGFSTIKISPISGYLDWARGEVSTPRGMVSIEWKKVNDEIFLDATVPQKVPIELDSSISNVQLHR